MFSWWSGGGEGVRGEHSALIFGLWSGRLERERRGKSWKDAVKPGDGVVLVGVQIQDKHVGHFFNKVSERESLRHEGGRANFCSAVWRH